MGEIEGTYRSLQTPAGTRLGAQYNTGISTLEPGQSLSSALGAGGKGHNKSLQIRVQGLDDAQEFYELESKADGQTLSSEVFRRINLIESDYFGLEFQNLQMNWVWLEPTKLIVKQPVCLYLLSTGYLFSLQIKRDLMEGRLNCTENTAALLASHLVQSEIGDYDDIADREFLKINKLLPYEERVQEKIMELHRRHIGQTPAESDFQVLEIARKLEMYGVRFHPAADREGTKINLAVAHMGLQVFQGHTKINTFNWSKIRKLSFKRKRFLIKLHPEVHGPHQDTLEFLMGSRDQCKIFWKNCVEHHSFFRLLDQPQPQSKAIFFSRGSSFRYRCTTVIILMWVGNILLNMVFQKKCSNIVSVVVMLVFPALLINAEKGKLEIASYDPFNSCSPFFHPVDSANDIPQLSPFNTKGPLCLSPSFQMSTLSLPGQAPSPLQSPILNEVGTARLEEDEEGRRKRYPTDKAYFIAKEILTTERTYLKDLEVITVWFRGAVIKENAMPEGLMTLLFSNIDPIYEFHRGFLKEIDQRLALWEGRSNAHVKGDYQRIGDVMLRNMCALKEFIGFLQKHDEVFTELEKATKRVKKLETVYKEFELQKVCYLPLNTFLLKPIQRLMHYKLILERLCKHYAPQHRDYDDCKEALKEVAEIAAQLQSSLIRLENFQKLTELQRDLIGIENLTAPGRVSCYLVPEFLFWLVKEFIREGCLYKLTKKGLQQRMFFLFSDMLLYTSKGVTATNQFKVHGQLPLHGMIVEESENEWSVPHCFTIYSAQRTIVVAQESEDDMNSSRCSLDKQSHHRANTTMHVCWHRNTSVSMSDHSLAVENQLSGYLLRKFKNSNGWQKLWVVFTNFCLFFYKTHQDFPLASLPLLGYTVSTPEESDSIHKEYVFKLQFKSHVYFFRAESEYTFERWMEVIKSAASSAGRMSLLVPKGPAEMNGGS
uniref:FERM, ARHGEF and pleckstrin domain-containing protein 2 n=1 Tax=Sinocyclocheilus anshuiensis TaxID=1608454 RepID=A0A671SUT4_9TELE